MLRLETWIGVAAAIFAIVLPKFGDSKFRTLEHFLSRFAENRSRAVIAVGLLAIAARVVMLPILPIPYPAVHDEYSYLLMADTFAHGRLANPSPPMWEHFETFHENMVPTYVSKYFPAQGAFLAAGQVALGNPFWGVVLSSGCMCAAICWMLQGWLPPGWALLGGVLAVIRLGTFSYWVNSYWGGCVAAFAGALVIGALPRILREQRPRDAIIMALGVGLLFHSRPYEASLLCCPVGIAFLIWAWNKRGTSSARSLNKDVLPFAAVTAVILAGMLYYFWRTTGSPFRMPYMVNEQTYMANPAFPWQPRGEPPVYHHASMQAFYQGWVAGQYLLYRSNPRDAIWQRSRQLWAFYFGPIFQLLPIALILAMPRGIKVRDLSRPMQFLNGAVILFYVGLMLPVYFAPHYAAPAVAVGYCLLLFMMKYLSEWKPWGSPVGLMLVRATVVAVIVLVPVRAFAARLHVSVTPSTTYAWASRTEQFPERKTIEDSLRSEPARALVIVRYRSSHFVHREWVYNCADIDRAKIVWARDMGEFQNRELINRFQGRQVWLLEADQSPPKLARYGELRSPASSDGTPEAKSLGN